MCPSVRIDISDEIQAKLPSPVAAALHEVEQVYRRSVRFFLIPELGVTAGGRASPEGFVELPPHSRSNLNVIGEEIMHLHRWAKGYPAIEPTECAEIQGYGLALRGLGGHFDEYAFFPFLESADLDPRSQLEPRFRESVGMLRSGLLDRIPRENGSRQFVLGWRVRLVVAYVQAALLGAPSANRDSLLELFEKGPLQPYAELGRRISLEISQTYNATPGQVEVHMSTCLFTHLNLPTSAATVRYLF